MGIPKEEIEKKIEELKPMVTAWGGGSALEIVKVEGNKVTLKLIPNPNFGTFKVQGKIIGPKEAAEEAKPKIEARLKPLGIAVKFVN